MKKMFLIITAVLLVALGTHLVLANGACDGEGLCIAISPATLALDSQSVCVSVHSNIPYSTVNTVSLTLNGIPAKFTKADARGELVVKFESADVKDIVEPGSVTLTLVGLYKDGDEFQVSDTITVR